MAQESVNLFLAQILLTRNRLLALYMCVCVRVRVCVCIYVCMYVCMYVRMYVCACVLQVSINIWP
jgi:hypothetical protein